MSKVMRRIVRAATKGLTLKGVDALKREREENEAMEDVSEFIPHATFVALTLEFWEGRN